MDHSGKKKIKIFNKTEMIHRLVVYTILDSFNKNSEESDRRLQWDEELIRQRWTGIVL